MTIKSVVDIDLDDAKFKRFTDLYSKYETALKKQPGEWKQAEKGAEETGDAVTKVMAAFLATGQFHRELADSNEKDNKNLKKKASLWEGISKSSGKILKDVEGIAKFMLTIGGIALGAGIAGFFGIRSIARDVSNQRNQALGLDLNVGEHDAFARDQGRYFNADAFLQGASTARSNLASPAFQAIASLGINPNQSTVQVADQLLLKLQQMAKAMPQQQLGNLLQEYPGLSQFGVDLEGLKRLRNISTSELKGQISAFGPDARNAGLSDRQARAFQDFTSSVDRTFASVSKQIERDLVPLLGPIQKLIKSLGADVSMFLRSKTAAEGIDAFAKAIDRFANYLSSSEFKNDIKDLESGTSTIFQVLGFIGHLLAHPLDTLGEGAGDIWTQFKNFAKAKEAEAHGGDPNWKEKEQARQEGGFIRNMRDHVNQHPGAAGLHPLALSVMPLPKPLLPVKVQAHVNVHVSNATGSNINAAVNQLSGGVG